MLNKKESLLMTVIFKEAEKRNGFCLIKPIDLLTEIPYNVDFKAEELQPILEALSLDEYIEFNETEKKGEPYLLIELLKKGKAFQREIITTRRSKKSMLAFKIFCAILAACASLIISKVAGLFG